jgi:hypothetical protein
MVYATPVFPTAAKVVPSAEQVTAVQFAAGALDCVQVLPASEEIQMAS